MAVGVATTVTVVGGDVALQLFAAVTVTLKVPEVETVIDCVVCPPGDHSHEAPALADNVTLPPGQKVVGPLAEIVAAGGEFSVMVVEGEVTGQLMESLTTTE